MSILSYLLGSIAAGGLESLLPHWAILLITGLVVAMMVRALLRARRA